MLGAGPRLSSEDLCGIPITNPIKLGRGESSSYHQSCYMGLVCLHPHTRRILQASKLPCLQRAGEVGVCVPTSRQPDWPVLGAHNEQTDTLSPGRQVEATGGTRGCVSYSMGSPAFTSISCLAHGVVSEYFHDSEHPAQYQLSPEVSPFCVQLPEA